MRVGTIELERDFHTSQTVDTVHGTAGSRLGKLFACTAALRASQMPPFRQPDARLISRATRFGRVNGCIWICPRLPRRIKTFRWPNGLTYRRKRGDLLHPERESRETLDRIKAQIGRSPRRTLLRKSFPLVRPDTNLCGNVVSVQAVVGLGHLQIFGESKRTSALPPESGQRRAGLSAAGLRGGGSLA
jgi:hypothetical protein